MSNELHQTEAQEELRQDFIKQMEELRTKIAEDPDNLSLHFHICHADAFLRRADDTRSESDDEVLPLWNFLDVVKRLTPPEPDLRMNFDEAEFDRWSSFQRLSQALMLLIAIATDTDKPSRASVVGAFFTALEAGGHLNLAAPKLKDDFPNISKLIAQAERLRSTRAKGGKAAGRTRTKNRIPEINQAGAIFRREKAVHGSDNSGFEAIETLMHDQVSRSTARLWAEKGYFERDLKESDFESGGQFA